MVPGAFRRRDGGRRAGRPFVVEVGEDVSWLVAELEGDALG
jgi:hypothetical protein